MRQIEKMRERERDIETKRRKIENIQKKMFFLSQNEVISLFLLQLLAVAFLPSHVTNSWINMKFKSHYLKQKYEEEEKKN